MPRTIQQSVVMPASPARLFAMYLNPVTHSAFTGGKAKMSAKPGSAFSAFGGTLTGTILLHRQADGSRGLPELGSGLETVEMTFADYYKSE